MRFRPLAPHPSESSLRNRRDRLRLPPGSYDFKRGPVARRGEVAWNQRAETLWRGVGPVWNTMRPFWDADIVVRFWMQKTPREEDRALDLLRWINIMEVERDWRKVAEDRLMELEAIMEDLKRYAWWHLGVPEENGSKHPFGEERPISMKAIRFLEGVANLTKCVTVCRVRIEETKTKAMRRAMAVRAIGEALDEEASLARMKAWDEKTAESPVEAKA